jgi:hypothetical protein
MSTSIANRKPLEKSRTFHRLKLTDNEDFTIPETASLFCSGGGIFRNGIAIGNNNSIIPGSIRYSENKLQYLKNEGWLNVTGFFENNCRENSIAKFGSDGELKDTSILIENNDIAGVEVLETEFLVPPYGKNLKIGNIQWPSDAGSVNHVLRFTSPGILEPSAEPVPIYDAAVGINKLIYFGDINGKLVNSDINISGQNLSNVGTLSATSLSGGNIQLSLNTLQGTGGLTLLSNNGNLGLTTTTNNNINLSTFGTGAIQLNSSTVDKDGKLAVVNTATGQNITFGVAPPASASSPGTKGDHSWDEDYVYICVSDNTWKRASLSSW